MLFGVPKFEIEGFADIHQLYKPFMIFMQRKALGEDMNSCLQHIAKWMNEHFLRLNQTKTKILVFAPSSKGDMYQGSVYQWGVYSICRLCQELGIYT